jgi:carboxymethylenebutenolidase
VIGWLLWLTLLQVPSAAPAAAPEIVSFQNGALPLRGVLYKPAGPGPFRALVYNHGSAPGMLNSQAFEQLGPLFAARGWVFFAPYRRGQGLSAEAGPFIVDEIAAARRRAAWLAALIAVPFLLLLFRTVVRKKRGWPGLAAAVAAGLCAQLIAYASGARAGASVMVRLLETEHLGDQLAGLEWLRGQPFVDGDRIAAAGNSFGGIETVLGAEQVGYCAAIDASGGAESWGNAPRLRAVMTRAVRNAKAPIFFFQAENDYDLSPSRSLSAAMKDAGRVSMLKIYPAFGQSSADGHSFAWSGSAVWADDVFQFLDRHCPR